MTARPRAAPCLHAADLEFRHRRSPVVHMEGPPVILEKLTRTEANVGLPSAVDGATTGRRTRISQPRLSRPSLVNVIGPLASVKPTSVGLCVHPSRSAPWLRWHCKKQKAFRSSKVRRFQSHRALLALVGSTTMFAMARGAAGFGDQDFHQDRPREVDRSATRLASNSASLSSKKISRATSAASVAWQRGEKRARYSDHHPWGFLWRLESRVDGARYVEGNIGGH